MMLYNILIFTKYESLPVTYTYISNLYIYNLILGFKMFLFLLMKRFRVGAPGWLSI